MLTEPKIRKQSLIAAIETAFGLSVRSLDFLPIGADVHSFSYDCHTNDHRRFYLKLRLVDDADSDLFSASLDIARQVEGAIHPVTNKLNDLNWLQFGSYKVILFPFVTGVAGWDITLTPPQWQQVGRTFRSLHNLVMPDPLKLILPREDFSDKWRVMASKYLKSELSVLAEDRYADEMNKLLAAKRSVISDIIDKAQELSEIVPQDQLEFVCCHGDLHSGNFLVTETGTAHPADWDNLSIAPREKDLMFIGGGVGGMLDGPNATELFRRSYGTYQVSVQALRYFRFERIVEDVVAYCEQLLGSEEGGADRAVSLEQFSRQFGKGSVVDMAYKT